MFNNFLDKFGDESPERPASTPGQEQANLYSPYNANLTLIEKGRDFLRKRSREQIVFSPPFITCQELGCLFRGTINVLQGRKGVHKSRITEILCSLLLSGQGQAHQIGFEAQTDTDAFNVLYVDTERNLADQFPAAIQRIKALAGFEMTADVPRFDFISLIEVPRAERFEALRDYLETFRKQNQGHLFIVLDVLTDCVENFNDPRASLQLVDFMNVLVNQYDVTFLAVIHENPNDGGKARGHLGTEVVNKASQVMQIGFERDSRGNDTDLIRLKFLHCRSTKRLEPLYFRYSDEVRGLVLADETFVREQQDLRKAKAAPTEVLEWLRENLTGSMAKDDLFESLQMAFVCGSRTLEERIKELVTEGHLIRETINRKVHYRLPDDVPF